MNERPKLHARNPKLCTIHPAPQAVNRKPRVVGIWGSSSCETGNQLPGRSSKGLRAWGVGLGAGGLGFEFYRMVYDLGFRSYGF